MPKPILKDVTIIAVDTTPKANLAARAIQMSLMQCHTHGAKLLTNQKLPFSVEIPEIKGLEGYSNFCITEMHKYVATSHALVVQADGYVLNGDAWTDEFLKYDYIGAPWLPSNAVGNGGFSLRSRRLLKLLADKPFGDNPHPEDNYICLRHRQELESAGMIFAPVELARRFAFEGRSWNNGIEWSGVPVAWSGSFGFHSWLTPLPDSIPKPKIFHHTGDWGDVIYSLPVIKSKGGGVLFLSDDNRFPFPRPSRERVTAEWVNNISPLLEQQDYIHRASFTHGLPFSTDYDLNKFRLPWKNPGAPNAFNSIFALHNQAFNVQWPEDKPWLKVDKVTRVDGRPIVVSRSSRYQNLQFPWWDLVQKYGDKMVFVGSPLEAEMFQGWGAPHIKIPWLPTRNLLEVAQVIAGGSVFIGNQSCPLAIAHGLGKPVVVEEWPQNANCRLNRPNALYWRGGEINIPEVWL